MPYQQGMTVQSLHATPVAYDRRMVAYCLRCGWTSAPTTGGEARRIARAQDNHPCGRKR